MFSWYGSNYPIFISAQRWVETVKNLKCNDYEFQEKATVFEYIMCLPARREKIRDNVLSFMPVNERLCVLRIKGRISNTSLICVYAPSDDKADRVNPFNHNHSKLFR